MCEHFAANYLTLEKQNVDAAQAERDDTYYEHTLAELVRFPLPTYSTKHCSEFESMFENRVHFPQKLRVLLRTDSVFISCRKILMELRQLQSERKEN